jgi:hypothetical protein
VKEEHPQNCTVFIIDMYIFGGGEYFVNGRVHCIRRSKGKRMYKGCLLRTDFYTFLIELLICKHFSLTHCLYFVPSAGLRACESLVNVVV